VSDNFMCMEGNDHHSFQEAYTPYTCLVVSYN
jgi:hypothetical protein